MRASERLPFRPVGVYLRACVRVRGARVCACVLACFDVFVCVDACIFTIFCACMRLCERACMNVYAQTCERVLKQMYTQPPLY